MLTIATKLLRSCSAYIIRCRLLKSRHPYRHWRCLLAIPAMWLCVTTLAQPTDDTDFQSRSAPLAALLKPSLALQPGQSSTALPDGYWLILGGIDKNGRVNADAIILNGKTSVSKTLTAKLIQARSEHSATLLPDGSVLILGGIGDTGAVLSTAEKFDPATGQFSSLGELGLIARAGHTATVLADGNLLISGGTDQHGHVVYENEIYHLVGGQAELSSIKQNTARMNHLAALLPSADVLLWGGLDANRQERNDGEVFNTSQQRFNIINAEVANALSRPMFTGAPKVTGSMPAAEEKFVPVDKPLMVHFSQRMATETLNSTSVTLIGPQGSVPIKIVPVELGTLLFITPLQDLAPSSRYTLFVSNATNELGAPLPFTAIGFDTLQLGGQDAATTTMTSNAADAAVSNSLVAQDDAIAIRSNAPPAQAQLSTLSGVERQAIAAAAAVTTPETWLPDATHFKGDWRTRRAASPLQKLPPLMAAEGETALSGQVLTLHGHALTNVTLTIGGQSVRSDATGRFLLTNLNPGQQVLSIDGQTAGHGNIKYGYYQARVDIKSHQTTALSYTIWSARLDPAGDMPLPSPTLRDEVLTSPRIPGLELHLPAGTIIRDSKGKIVTNINMTAIPTDRPPFPIPGVGVPVYFTIQPGGASLTSATGRTQGAQLIYPNFSGAKPGTRIDFWNYDTQAKGWYIYGQGTVTADGKQVRPDVGVRIYEFTGAMVALPSSAPPPSPPPKCPKHGGGGAGSDNCNADPNQPSPPASCAGDPVDCATGLFLNAGTDLVIDDVIPLKVTRSYRPQDLQSRAFGIGTNLSYDIFLVGDRYPYTYQDLILPDGARIHYKRISPGTDYQDAIYRHSETTSKYFGSTIRHGSLDCYWELDLKDGARLCFPIADGSPYARAAAATSISDRNGNTLKFERAGIFDSNVGYGDLKRITSPSGRYLQFTYDTKNRITQAVDNIGRVVSYQYDATGNLVKVTDPEGKFEAFTYDANHNMLTVQDKRGNIMVTNVYDVNSRVSEQTYADGSKNQFSYELDATGKITRTDITDERGTITRMLFNSVGSATSITKAYGLPEQQTVIIEYDPATNLMLSSTDALGRKTSYTYDDNGNMLTRTALSGTASAMTMRMSYTADFNRLASVTDYLGHQSMMRYDSKGNLIEAEDANGNVVKQRFNDAGQIIELTNALGKSSVLGYDVHDLASVTDPLGRVVQLFSDSAGRLRGTIDSLGGLTHYDVDTLDRVTQSTDPLSQVITQDFDANGNATGITDPKGNLHKFIFDQRNAPTANVDPLNQNEAYVYDAKHNLIQKTDRKGQVTRYVYDALDRLISTSYDDGAKVSTGYDKGNRIVRIADSDNGSITFNYDQLDRVTEVSTPKGKVAYTYDANGRRETMNVLGLPSLRYSYDAGGRLTRMDQAAGPANNGIAQSISFAYDAANHRVRTVYTNGIVRSNIYDDAGQLTSIVYTNADGTTLGDLNYNYDKGGRRTQTGGSLARTMLPEALSNASVDAANRLVTFGTQTLGYDANGNLISDGRRNYSWNARNQLIQIRNLNGEIVASFTYDGLGRRQTKIVGGVTTSYVYDSLNIIQELTGMNTDNGNTADVRASYISGGVDEVFAQLTGSGVDAKVNVYLTDALGSTIRLLDLAGNTLSNYTYDPYGVTTVDGYSQNPFQYSGRENDGIDLYYYRARYYSPILRRFISGDPIGLRGGINIYEYVEDDPINNIDPMGLQVWPAGQLPPRVEQHNAWTNSDRQMISEFGNKIGNWNDPMPKIPQPTTPWCTLHCPSDTPNSCPARPPTGIEKTSPNGEQCVEVCVFGPFANSDSLPTEASDSRAGQRNASRGDWQKLVKMMRSR